MPRCSTRSSTRLPRPLSRPSFDLSKVPFICTATRSTRSGPAARPDGRDPPLRLDNARREARHCQALLVPKQLKAHGENRPWRSATGAELVIAEYTREAVSRAQRQIARLPQGRDADRKGRGREGQASTRRVCESGLGLAVLEPRRAAGRPSRGRDGPRRTRPWAEVRLFIEATAYPAGGAADHRPARRGRCRSPPRRRCRGCGPTPRARHAAEWFAEHDLHVHVPAARCRRTGPRPG